MFGYWFNNAIFHVHDRTPLSFRETMKRKMPKVVRCYYKTVKALTRSQFFKVRIRKGPLSGQLFRCSLRRERHYWLGTCEQNIQNVFEEHLSQGMVVYDVGVHKAFFALLAAKCVGKAGRVVGFEPNPLNFDIAVQNLELSPDLAGVVTLRKKAVSNTCGTAVFNVKKRGASSGKIVRESDANGATMTEVESVTLDSVIKTDRLPVPDLIKIDIEGEEEFALAGMKETIATARPTIVIEVHDEPSWTAFLAAMDEQGYRWWQIMDDGELVRRPQGWEYRSHYLAMPADQDESPLRSSRGRN